ncbi:MAG TPA: two-component regulator propeller domain-containing protein [Dongiaceae bacterium]|nr:two-component regulator propeller domain-containing protein [Dongiaceae bacterium]
MIAAVGVGLGASGSLAWGADARFIVERFGWEQGLPQSCVAAMTQARDGYLWVGTLGGLARFDGRRFTRFDADNTPGLKGNRIVSLFEDSRTNLWIGTESEGVALVSPTGGITHVALPGQLKAICEDSNGAVWLLSADTGADGSTAHLARFYKGSLRSLLSWPVGTSRCRALIAEDSGLLWVGTDDMQTSLRPNPDAAASAVPQVVNELPVGRWLDFLLASRRGGYWRLANLNITKCRKAGIDRSFRPRDYPWNQMDNSVTAVCEDLQGNLVAGTKGGEVYWFNEQGQWTRIGREQGLPRSAVLSLYVDREGCLWVGTNGEELIRVKRPAFELLPPTAELVVQSVCEDGHGGLWIGYNQEQVDHWTGQATIVFTNIVEQAGTLKESVYVRSVYVDRDGRVWVGTQNQGLFQFQDGGFKPAPGAERINRHIFALYQDRRGTLWAGTAGGLARWDGREWRAAAATNGLSTNAVQAIVEDGQGNLWAGTAGGGVGCLREGRSTWFTRTKGLPSDNVFSLLVDQEGVLWAGTAGGLGRFRDGRWSSITRKEGLPVSYLGYLAEDREGYLWIGSYGGLVRVPKQTLNEIADGPAEKKALANAAGVLTERLALRTYGKPDGLPTSECTFGSQPAACETADGRLWFPTTRGLAGIDPAQLHPNTNPPPVVIESVSIQGRPGTNSFRGAPPQEVVIPAGKGGLDIQYTSLNLAAADRARFSYWMENHERDRSPPRDERDAYYGKLPPGRYRFHVTACNEDGVWNKEGSTLAVTVLPPFWQTWWFLTAAAVSLLGMIVGSVHYVSTQRLQRQLVILRQHEALEGERARIARDLHDQLGANLTQVALLGELAETDKELPEEVAAHARQISQTARETTLALDEIVWTVNPANDTLDGLVNYLCKYAQEYLALAGLRYRLEVPAQLRAIPITPELRHNVFLVAKEAVNNIVKHAAASSVWLRLRLDPGRFMLEIEDDGRGLGPGAAEKGRNGLRNMRQRMEDIGGEFVIGPGPERGTVARISAPLEEWSLDGS